MASYTVTDQQITNEIQMTLLETPNNGASYGSGLFTASEVASRLNNTLCEFMKLTALRVKQDTVASTANVRAQALPTNAIDVLSVAYPNSSGTIYSLMKGSTAGADMFVSDLHGSNAAVDLPLIYTFDVDDNISITLLPPPNASRNITFVYVPKPTTLPSTPNGTTLDCPDDFTPFIKYGVLADLFNKSGETYDPQRAQICQQLYQMGVELARSWTSGNER